MRLILFTCLLAACTPTTQLAKFTHEDLQKAAQIAMHNDYPAIASVYLAIDGQLTACENAWKDAPQKTTGIKNAGFFTAYELTREGVGIGLPRAIAVNCQLLPIPSGLMLTPPH